MQAYKLVHAGDDKLTSAFSCKYRSKYQYRCGVLYDVEPAEEWFYSYESFDVALTVALSIEWRDELRSGPMLVLPVEISGEIEKSSMVISRDCQSLDLTAKTVKSKSIVVIDIDEHRQRFYEAVLWRTLYYDLLCSPRKATLRQAVDSVLPQFKELRVRANV